MVCSLWMEWCVERRPKSVAKWREKDMRLSRSRRVNVATRVEEQVTMVLGFEVA